MNIATRISNALCYVEDWLLSLGNETNKTFGQSHLNKWFIKYI